MSFLQISIGRETNMPPVDMVWIGNPVHHIAHDKNLHVRVVKSGCLRAEACFGGLMTVPMSNANCRVAPTSCSTRAASQAAYRKGE